MSGTGQKNPALSNIQRFPLSCLKQDRRTLHYQVFKGSLFHVWNMTEEPCTIKYLKVPSFNFISSIGQQNPALSNIQRSPLSCLEQDRRTLHYQIFKGSLFHVWNRTEYSFVCFAQVRVLPHYFFRTEKTHAIKHDTV